MVNLDAASLLEQAGRYAHLLDGYGACDGPIRIASDHGLLRALVESSTLIRLLEAQRARIAGDIARRSDGAGDASLARKQGTTGPADLAAQVAGMRRQKVGTLVTIGKATGHREALTGNVLEPERPHVAEAFAAGRLDRTVTSALLRCLKQCESGLTPGELLEMERQMVERSMDGTTAD